MNSIWILSAYMQKSMSTNLSLFIFNVMLWYAMKREIWNNKFVVTWKGGIHVHKNRWHSLWTGLVNTCLRSLQLKHDSLRQTCCRNLNTVLDSFTRDLTYFVGIHNTISHHHHHPWPGIFCWQTNLKYITISPRAGIFCWHS